MTQTAINLYSVRDLDEPVLDILDRVSKAGYDGVQFSGSHTPLAGDLEEITGKLDETGLDTTAAHIGIDEFETDRETVLSAYETVGVSEGVVPYLPASDFASEAAVDATAARLVKLDEELDQAGWNLHYHNHNHEFVDLGAGHTAFEVLIQETDVAIELDVGWAQFAGCDPVDLIERYGDRMTILHMKDVATDADRDSCFREIGEGDVDMQSCADVAREHEIEWLVYEHDAPEDPVESISTGAECLNSL